MGLVRVLDNGLHSKRMADWALEGCEDVGSALDELYRLRIQMTEDTRSAEVAKAKALGYLRRYFSLVAFCGYLRSGDFEKAQFGTSDKGLISSSRLSLGRSIVSYTVCFICQVSAFRLAPPYRCRASEDGLLRGDGVGRHNLLGSAELSGWGGTRSRTTLHASARSALRVGWRSGMN